MAGVRVKKGGRTKGTLNKRTVLLQSVRERCEAMGFDPIDMMIRIAIDSPECRSHKNKRIPTLVRQRACEALAAFIYPRKRAIDFTIGGEATLNHEHTFNLQALTNEEVLLLMELRRKATLPPAESQTIDVSPADTAQSKHVNGKLNGKVHDDGENED